MIGFIINIMKEGMRMNQDNILVVEDEIEIAKAIEIYLKSQGYNVYIANNGKAGLEMVERYDIHLAIVDIMMPVMDGIEMTMKIRENVSAMYLIAWLIDSGAKISLRFASGVIPFNSRKRLPNSFQMCIESSKVPSMSMI